MKRDKSFGLIILVIGLISFFALDVNAHYYSGCVLPSSGDLNTEFTYYVNSNHHNIQSDNSSWCVLIDGDTFACGDTQWTSVEGDPDGAGS